MKIQPSYSLTLLIFVCLLVNFSGLNAKGHKSPECFNYNNCNSDEKDYTFCYGDIALTLFAGGNAVQVRYGVGGTVLKTVRGDWTAYGSGSLQTIKITFEGSYNEYTYSLLYNGVGVPSKIIDGQGREYGLCKASVSSSNSNSSINDIMSENASSSPTNNNTSNTIVIDDLEVMKNDIKYSSLTWEEAVEACSNLGDGWHLPTQNELIKIYNNRDKFPNMKGNTYWSSTRMKIKEESIVPNGKTKYYDGAYMINFSSGECGGEQFVIGQASAAMGFGSVYEVRHDARAVRITQNTDKSQNKSNLDTYVGNYKSQHPTMDKIELTTISFEKIKRDLGSVVENDSIVSTPFSFRNSGDKPLIINSVTASCGCITTKWKMDSVAPGRTGVIWVSYNPKARTGSFNETITVSSNTKQSTSILTIYGNVVNEKPIEDKYPYLQGNIRLNKYEYLKLGNVSNIETTSEIIEFINISNSTIKLNFPKTPNYLRIRIEPSTIKPGETGVIKIDFDPREKGLYGNISDHISCSIDGEEKSEFFIRIFATVIEDFSKYTPDQIAKAPIVVIDKNEFDFGDIKQGESVKCSFKLTNNGKTDLLIRDVKTTCSCIIVENDDIIKPNKTKEIKVEFKSEGKTGRQNKSVTLMTNDPKNSSIVLRIKGNINSN